MKPEEAISAIKNNMPTKGTYAILTEALEVAIQALEKQIVKKPIETVNAYNCFRCGKNLAFKDDYCWNCGQKLDWSVEE